MDIKNLETFVMVAELKNFTEAAKKLGYTQMISCLFLIRIR